MTAIKVTNLSKTFNISGKYERMRLADGILQLFGVKKTSVEKFYALNDISFQVNKGETFGIIGRNGSGKSTLLKILSEVTEPSKGEIEIWGKVASVLEVGIGFHPELTGRENIYLSGNLHNLNRKEIDLYYDEIVEFSGIEKFIETPIKHYSSGMFMRLAFSIVANFNADIFLFDEVFAVGDIPFQKKCMNKIKQLTEQGKTVLIVSHNVTDIAELCSSVICLDNGKIVNSGSIEVVKKYYEEVITGDVKINHAAALESSKTFINKTEEYFNINDQKHNSIRVKELYVSNESRKGATNFYTNDIISINIEYDKLDEGEYDIIFALTCINFTFLVTNMRQSNIYQTLSLEKGTYHAQMQIPANFFNESIIEIGLAIGNNKNELVFSKHDILMIKISCLPEQKEYLNNYQKYIGPLLPKYNWIVNRNSK